MHDESSHVLFGRDSELAVLREAFDACARERTDGGLGGPRMVFIVAESGIGKSRLVQELYLQLTTDSRWDPADYWPDAFRDDRSSLAVVPDMTGHVPKGPPRFAWLGARWRNPGERNANVVSALPELRASITVHARILEQYGPAWAAARMRIVQSIGKELGDELVNKAVDVGVGEIPFFGLLWKLGKGAVNLARERARGPRSVEVENEELSKTESEEALTCIRLLLGSRSAIPTVLWLDDAQWMDAEAFGFVEQLWAEATKHDWPLLIMVTHWEREWNELQIALRRKPDSRNLASLATDPRSIVMQMANSTTAALESWLMSRLPGLTNDQKRLLVEKAAGNFLTMVENVSELLAEPLNFLGESRDAALTDIATDHIRKFESDRLRRVAQRFQGLDSEMRKTLGWAAQVGHWFLLDAVSEFARHKLQRDGAQIIERCIDPYVVLTRSSELTCEFRDKAFYHVATAFFTKYLGRDAEELRAFVRARLAVLVNEAFEAIPEDNIDAFPTGTPWEISQERDLYALAHEWLPVPMHPDSSNVEDVASLRAVFLLVAIDRHECVWHRVRRHAGVLYTVRWDLTPDEVMSTKRRLWLSDALTRVKSFGVAKALASDALGRASDLFSRTRDYDAALLLSCSLSEMAFIAGATGSARAQSELDNALLDHELWLVDYFGTAASLQNLSISLCKLADAPERDPVERSALYDKAIACAREAFRKHSSPWYERNLAYVLVLAAKRARAQDHDAKADSLLTEALSISERLATESPTTSARGDVARVLQELGAMAQERKQYDVAREHYLKCASLRREVVEEDGAPDNYIELAESIETLVQLSMKDGAADYDSVMRGYDEIIQIWRMLAFDFGTSRYRFQLALYLHSTSLMFELTDAAEWLQRAEESLSLTSELARQPYPPDKLGVLYEEALANCIRAALANSSHAVALTYLDLGLELANKPSDLGTLERAAGPILLLGEKIRCHLALGNADAAAACARLLDDFAVQLPAVLQNTPHERIDIERCVEAIELATRAHARAQDNFRAKLSHARGKRLLANAPP